MTDVEGRTAGGIAYTVAPGGVGAPVVLVHGQFGTRAGFGSTMAQVAKTRPVAALDLPWHGASVRPTKGSTDVLGEAIHEVLDALGWSRVAAVGHSLGTLALLDAALRTPSRFEALLLVGCIGDLTPELRGRMSAFGAALAGGFTRAHAEMLAGLWYSQAYRDAHPGLVDELLPKLQVNDAASAVYLCDRIAERPARLPELHRVTARTTFVAAKEDAIAPLALTQPFVDALSAPVVELEGGHFPFEEQPAAWARTVERFLASAS